MRVIQLTAGTGNFYCGSCLRDNALMRGLRDRGHDAVMVPLYLPVVLDEPSATDGNPIFLSGISVYLGQMFNIPGWLDRAFSSPALLRFAAGLVGMTSPEQLGESTVAMLQPDAAHRELERLLVWLRAQPPPDVICLSNSLLSGLAGPLKKEFRVPIVCTLQGEDSFLEALPEPYRQRSWELLAQRCTAVDHFIAVSKYFADVMAGRLGLAAGRVSVAHPGIAVDEFPPATAAEPVIGYLARMHPAKGLDTLVEAFLLVKTPGARLRIAGAMTGGDKPFVASLREKLGGRADFMPNLDRAAKVEFLRSLAVFSVPATSGEAFGMYILEALAAGVPVVQPRHGAFSEVLAATGGGVLCEPNQPSSLAVELDQLLGNPARARQIGALGRQTVRDKFTIHVATGAVEAILRKVTHAG